MSQDCRTIEEMIGYVGAGVGAGRGDAGDREAIGGDRREPLSTGRGFRHRYDAATGEGGWDFHNLNDALSMAVVDFRAARPISRLHRHDDHLVFSAVIEGRSAISMTDRADGGELAHGFCTFYGLSRGEPVRTVYEPGRALRWVSVFLRCDRIREICGFDPEAMPPIFRDFILHGEPLGIRHVPLGNVASMAALQVFDCLFTGELRRLFLIAKAIEIVCGTIHGYAGGDAAPRTVMTADDTEKVQIAKQIIEENLDDPLSVGELASVVGLSTQKLQDGFQALFSGSVGRVYKQVRLSRAMALVSETSMSMIEIALECGYEHPGSFTRAFKLAFGASPSLVRSKAMRGLKTGVQTSS